MLVDIFASGTAGQRTKNRLRENGPTFRVERRAASCHALGDRPAILLRSESTDWYGWLLVSETRVVPKLADEPPQGE